MHKNLINKINLFNFTFDCAFKSSITHIIMISVLINGLDNLLKYDIRVRYTTLNVRYDEKKLNYVKASEGPQSLVVLFMRQV